MPPSSSRPYAADLRPGFFMDPLGPPAAFGQGAFPALGAPSAAAFMAQVPGFASPFPPPPPPGAAPTYQQPAMGWGGQPIQDSAGFRAPWFGRNHGNKTLRSRKDESGNSAGSGRPEAPGFPGGFHKPAPGEATSAEELLALIQKVPKKEPLNERVFNSLYHLDSRAVALLLKDLARVGLDKRALELFEYLRGLPERHSLRSLCDVYTFTAMVSMCITQQSVDRAMELVEDMRQRGIERNVHTYTALMNVCIKCGRLPLALEVYNSMRSQGCMPNVVTFNTLVDVYGKLGQWEKAIQVVDSMKKEGVEPVLRTYNTLIIACNMCNQPREALACCQRLIADGFTPNSTTYNALISAYGKVGQLDKALDIYQTMVQRNMERSVITYSSVISACEKAGRWETALEVFNEMQQGGCTPNTVTYNSLITACAQGSQWEKANEVFEQMLAQGCTPDVVTYTALITAFERGGQWQKALAAFHKMCVQGCKPDSIVYNAIIDALWETGVVWAQRKALQLYRAAMQQGHFRRDPVAVNGKPQRAELNVHAMTAGVAILSLYTWLLEIRTTVLEQGPQALPSTLMIVTDMGRSSKEQGNCIVKEAVNSMMAFWQAPFKPAQNCMYTACLEAAGPIVAEWVLGQDLSALLAGLFPTSDTDTFVEETTATREHQVLQDCTNAFAAVQLFESTHGLILDDMCPRYMQERSALISRLLDVSNKLGLRDEVVHDAVLLMDRTASEAKQIPEDILQLLGTAALSLASKQGDASTNGDLPSKLEMAADVPASAIATMEWNIRQLLHDDTAAISTMRCLKVYLERMGLHFLGQQGVYGLAGYAIMMSVEALYDVSLLNCRPSVVAAALVYAERRLRGAVPFWPSTLAKLTGYEDMCTPELTVAVRLAQKLARKGVYSQIYRNQMLMLSSSAAEAALLAAQQQQPLQLLRPVQQQLQLPTTVFRDGGLSIGGGGAAPGVMLSAGGLGGLRGAMPGLLSLGQGTDGLSLDDSLAQVMQSLKKDASFANDAVLPEGTQLLRQPVGSTLPEVGELALTFSRIGV